MNCVGDRTGRDAGLGVRDCGPRGRGPSRDAETLGRVGGPADRVACWTEDGPRGRGPSRNEVALPSEIAKLLEGDA